MAEFKEVCKQWQRMCNSFKESATSEYRPCAEKCPVGCNPVCGELDVATPKDVERFEAAVMQWAAEHPVVYPTWKEYLLDIGVIPDEAVPPDYVQELIVMCVEKPIRADIAKKLGIEPKE